MTTKRASARRHPTKQAAATPSSELGDSAVLVVLESAVATPAGTTPISADLRRRLIETAAYFSAERRGFEPGHELEDWVAAEAAVDAQLRQTHAA